MIKTALAQEQHHLVQHGIAPHQEGMIHWQHQEILHAFNAGFLHRDRAVIGHIFQSLG